MTDDRWPGRSDGEDELRDQTVDQMFAEIMAGYHLTAEGRPQPAAPEPPAPQPAAPEPPESQPPLSWTPRAGVERDQPLAPRPAPAEPDEEFERYRPDPQPPLGRPSWPVLLGWSCMGWALVAALLVIFGVDLPAWAGWLAVLGFLSGFGLLVSQLPRHRPPDSGDGAVL